MDEPSIMDEDWALLQTLLPRDWQELGHVTKALKGLRKHKEPDVCLRTLLLHLACGYSLRETAVRARQAQLAELSDVAVLWRLRKSKEWLHQLCRRLLAERAAAAPPAAAGGALRLVDATLVQEPGPTGSQWRLHYGLRWPELRCDHFALTGTSGPGSGESLTHVPVQAGDHLVADRGYSHYRSVAHVAAHGGVVTVRLNPKAVRLLDAQGQPFGLVRRLRGLRQARAVRCWPVQLTGAAGEAPVAGRLCVLRKSQTAIARAHARVRRNAESNGRALQADTLLFGEYVLVFTTADETLSPAQILELYRLRWQIELVFKRFKQLAQLGHLPKEDEESAQAWLYGKLLVALLTQRLQAHAESFSPWGYDLETPAEPESVAGV